ncbi:iron transporter [Methanomicrobiaceae archaeon CYW5]|uniref:iron ABC transporter substrate-binding protein n=1 Tax=Methanovulcanius yangii TaxID=1789227 RepID=UPI0029CA6EA0|nr:iron ABC transporter substrate-binding protein [Methanovulcanius yangii]MBT8508497.1 iron transporter [Methanovulcanius yangii]
MKTDRVIFGFLAVAVCLVCAMACGCVDDSTSVQTSPEHQTGGTEMITVTDALGREVTVPKSPERVVCSGAGCLRYLTYLRAQDRIVGVDDIEQRDTIFDARPYALANPQFKDYPLIGEFRGNDDPEKIVAANPQVIFKTYLTSPEDADELAEKTGIPVIALTYGSLSTYRDDMYASLRLMGHVMDREERAEEVIAFFNAAIADLNTRTEDIPESEQPTTYVGGIAKSGPHGFQSTEPAYPPFAFVHANNVAGELGTDHADVAQEKIVEWDPELIFVDLSTLQTDPNAVTELRDDPSYQGLSAVQAGEVYGVLPYNWYTQNHGSIVADAYYIGTVLFPDRFSDVDPAAKADEIYTFLVGEPVFDEMNKAFGDKGFTRLSI